MKVLNYFAALMVLLAFTASHAEGMPLPWPFPWAKECPVDWTQLEGRYALSDTVSNDHSNGLKIAIVIQRGFRMIRVSRFSANGELIYDGYTVLSSKQRTVSLYLTNVNNSGDTMLATIKLHYQSEHASCTMDQLVPILTLDQAKHERVHYKLVRLHK